MENRKLSRGKVALTAIIALVEHLVDFCIIYRGAAQHGKLANIRKDTTVSMASRTSVGVTTLVVNYCRADKISGRKTESRVASR